MIPQPELDAFLRTVSQAEQLARAGRVPEGYLCLLTELNRAADAQDADQPWADHLIRRCNATLDDYAAAYGIGSSREVDADPGHLAAAASQAPTGTYYRD
jgi:hypothetical protein